MNASLFFRLLQEESKDVRLSKMIELMARGIIDKDVYLAEPKTFSQIPNSPFAYWVNDEIRSRFSELPAFSDSKRSVKQGLATADDFRFVRTSWEVLPLSVSTSAEATKADKCWTPFAKGGSFSPFYADLHLLVNWSENGREIKNNVNPSGKVRSNVWMLKDTERQFFFRPGITWPRSTVKGFNVRVLPMGSIFADKGPTAFDDGDSSSSLLALLACFNSSLFQFLLRLQTPSRSWEVGLVQQTPIPDLENKQGQQLASLATIQVDAKRSINQIEETSRLFATPVCLNDPNNQLGSIRSIVDALRVEIASLETAMTDSTIQIDDIVNDLYDLSEGNKQTLESTLVTSQESESEDSRPEETENIEERLSPS